MATKAQTEPTQMGVARKSKRVRAAPPSSMRPLLEWREESDSKRESNSGVKERAERRHEVRGEE